MFRTLQNTARLDLTLVPDGPLLVRAQTVGIDPGVADMEFQRTVWQGKSTVFLAGSGLKGVLRSHAERLLRSKQHFACDPTRTRDSTTCGTRRADASPPPSYLRPYRHNGQCAACFTFGSLKLSGRFRVADAYPAEGQEDATNQTEVRTGVGINRQSQGAQDGVLYDTEVVVAGGFRAQVSGENFSLWQLGLILAVLQDLHHGLVRIGGCKARGMGNVHVKDWKVELGFLNPKQGKLTGSVPEAPSGNPYDLPSGDLLDAPPGGEEVQKGLFRIVSYHKDADVQRLAETLIAGPLRSYLEEKR